MMHTIHIGRRALLLLIAEAWAVSAAAQVSRAKSIRLVVPFPPGGSSDTLGRLMAQGLSERLKQPVVVENRAGAGTVIGTDVVAKSQPDGATLLLTTPALAINATLRAGMLPYEMKDIEPVITLAEVPMAIYASPSSGFKDLDSVIQAARARPGTVSYGTAGEGSTGQLTMKMLEQAAGVEFEHVPFQGSAPSINALLGGHVQLAVDTAFFGSQYVALGKLIGVVTLGKSRSARLAQTPTALEAGVPVESSAWFGIALRAGTHRPTIDMLNENFREVLGQPAVREGLERDGFEVIADKAPEAQARFAREFAKTAAALRTETK